MDVEGIRVWALTWGEVISAAQHRMRFVQQGLNYHPSADPALEYLRRTHEHYLPPEISAPPVAGGQGTTDPVVDSGEA